MKKVKAYLCLATILTVFAALAVSCSDYKSPTASTTADKGGTEGGSGSAATATEPTPTPPATPPTASTDTSRGDYLGPKDGKVGAIVENLTGETLKEGFACYAGPHNDPGAQRMPEPTEDFFEVVNVKANDSKEIWVEEPCGPYQCDGFEGDVLTIPWYGSRLIFGRLGVGEVNCPPPPPPPPGCPKYTTDVSVREADGGLIYRLSSSINGTWFEDGQQIGTGTFIEVKVECESEARIRSFKFVPDGTPPGLDCSTPFTVKVPECPKVCKDFDITMTSSGPELTETDATYSFEVFIDGNSVVTYKKTYPRKETGYSETECYVAQATPDLRCEVCVTVKIPPKEKKVCEDFDTELRATKVEEDGASITYRFVALLNGQEVDRFRRTYLKGRTDRTEQECYVFTPTDYLRCQDCVEVKVPKNECQVERAGGCYYRNRPIGSPTEEAAWIGGVCFVHKDDGLSGFSFVATRDAKAALVKFGNFYHLYVDVTAGDILRTCFPTLPGGVAEPETLHQISHVSYFDCCVPN